jgi:hypothetical protein
MDAMSVDMNTTGNTDSVVSTIENCAQLTLNGIQDPGESGIDQLTFDVTAEGVPAFNDGGTPGVPADDTGGMIAYAFDLTYATGFIIQSQQTSTAGINMLQRNPGSSIFPAGDVPPDSDGAFQVSVLDTGAGTPEEGDGILHRITIGVAGTPPVDGVYPLTMVNNAHLDATGGAGIPLSTANGNIAVNQACP